MKRESYKIAITILFVLLLEILVWKTVTIYEEFIKHNIAYWVYIIILFSTIAMFSYFTSFVSLSKHSIKFKIQAFIFNIMPVFYLCRIGGIGDNFFGESIYFYSLHILIVLFIVSLWYFIMKIIERKLTNMETFFLWTTILTINSLPIQVILVTIGQMKV
jgi:hypothetical protein